MLSGSRAMPALGNPKRYSLNNVVGAVSGCTGRETVLFFCSGSEHLRAVKLSLTDTKEQVAKGDDHVFLNKHLHV